MELRSLLPGPNAFATGPVIVDVNVNLIATVEVIDARLTTQLGMALLDRIVAMPAKMV